MLRWLFGVTEWEMTRLEHLKRLLTPVPIQGARSILNLR